MSEKDNIQMFQAWRDRIPDARVSSHRRKTIIGPLGAMEEVFCINCGDPGGLVTHDWVEHVLYLCDPCAEKHGRLSMPEIPEPVVRGYR